MSFCRKCGAPVDEGKKFCTRCGAPVEGYFDKAVERGTGYTLPTPTIQHDEEGRTASTNEKGDATGGVIPYKNWPALVAYYLGVFAIIPMLGILLGIAAIILGIIGLKRKKQRPVIKGTVHAWVGIICGFLFASFWTLLLVAIVAATNF